MLTAVRLLAAALANMAAGLILLIRRLPIAKSATHGPLFSGLLRRLDTPTAMPERWVAAAAAGEPAEQLAHGIDCGCYYTANLFARGQHYSFRDVAHFDSFAAALRRSADAADAPGAADRASQEDEELPPNVSRLPAKERAAVLDALETEVRRRGGMVVASNARKRAISRGYERLHPELWELSEDFLHPDFIRLVQGLGASPPAEDGAPTVGGQAPVLRLLAPGAYVLPVFTPRFCQLMCEELSHFRSSGLPRGQPNSMNKCGLLLHELGLTDGLIEPLVQKWVKPLCKTLPSMDEVTPTIDHQRAFVVQYRTGEDESLAAHFDNAEVTLNANLGLDFTGGELALFGPSGGAKPTDKPTHFHDWQVSGVGHAVLHLGSRVHSALPISSGERLNLVIWMRSRAWRAEHGCPMCGETDRFL